VSTDPLSSATRTAKRNLLTAATVAITYSAFDVSISKIPLGGLAIEFDNRVFGFLLMAVLLYFMEHPLFEESMIDHMAGTLAFAMSPFRKRTTLRGKETPISRDEDPSLYKHLESRFRRALKAYRRRRRVHELMLLPSLYGVRVLYFIRNYLVDGLFPLGLGAFALAAVFQIIDLHWLRTLVPPPRGAS
jgi:hypothetical protein